MNLHNKTMYMFDEYVIKVIGSNIAYGFIIYNDYIVNTVIRSNISGLI